MTTPILTLLTPPTSLPQDTDVARPPFGVFLTTPPRPGPPTPPPALTLTSTTPVPVPHASSASDLEYDASRTNRALLRQWTGAPIRAIVPLPRRKHSLVLPNVSGSSAMIGPPPCPTRGAHRVWDDANADTDSDSDTDTVNEAKRDVEGGDIDDASAGSRYSSYESITAAEGLSAWSFEELRVECYAQSIVARGTKPLPVVQPSLAIPPAFVPRVVPRS